MPVWTDVVTAIVQGDQLQGLRPWHHGTGPGGRRIDPFKPSEAACGGRLLGVSTLQPPASSVKALFGAAGGPRVVSVKINQSLNQL